MMRKTTPIIVLAAVLLAGCATGSTTPTAATATRRYERPPIHEVSEEQLSLDSRLIDAIALREAGKTDEAVAALSALTAEAPDMAAAWYAQGELLAQRGWIDSALRCTMRAARLQPRNVWYHLGLASLHAVRGDAQAMAADWEQVVALRPDVLQYFYQLSNAYLAANDVAKAIEVLDRVEKRVGVSEEVSVQKQRLYESAGQSDKALAEAERLANAFPREARFQVALATRYMQQKKYPKAKQRYDRVLELAPDDPYIHLQLAEYYKQTHHDSEADREMMLSMAHPGLAPSVKVSVLTTFYRPEEFFDTRREVCFRLLDTAMRHSDDPREFALLYGDVLMRQQRYAEAAQQFETALERDSSQYAVWEALLACRADNMPDDEKTLDYARRAARLFPMQTLPLFLQGLYALRHEQWADALEPLQKAERWGFTNGHLEAETIGALAEAYYRTGDYTHAWNCFERYLKLRPNDWGMMNNYAYYLSERGEQLDKALELSRRTIEAEPDNANSLDTYAWILHLMGRDAEALPHMRRAVQLDPRSDTLQRHLKTIESAL